MSLLNLLKILLKYKIVQGNDGGIRNMDCANENYLVHMEFYGSNRLGNFSFGRRLAKLIFIYKEVGWSFEIGWDKFSDLSEDTSLHRKCCPCKQVAWATICLIQLEDEGTHLS